MQQITVLKDTVTGQFIPISVSGTEPKHQTVIIGNATITLEDAMKAFEGIVKATRQ